MLSALPLEYDEPRCTAARCCSLAENKRTVESFRLLPKEEMDGVLQVAMNRAVVAGRIRKEGGRRRA